MKPYQYFLNGAMPHSETLYGAGVTCLSITR
jgi:hypothetical protein